VLPTMRRLLPLIAVLAVPSALIAAPAASAEEVAAFSLDHRAGYSAHLSWWEPQATTFTARATGRLTRISVPVEHVSWFTKDMLGPVDVEVRETDALGRPAGALLAAGSIAPENVFQQPVDTLTYSYTGQRSEATFDGSVTLEQGRRYAVVLRTTKQEYELGLQWDDHDDAVHWKQSLCGCGTDGAWRSGYMPVAFRVFVEQAPPPPAADTVAPIAQISAPADGEQLLLGSAAHGRFACADEGGSGLTGCVGTLDGVPFTDGTAIDTSVVGRHILTVLATDGAQNTGSATSSFVVAWPFEGFFAPVDAAPVLNVIKAGSAVPIKFSLGGYRGLDVLDGTPTVRWIACGDEPVDELEEAASDVGSALTYDADSGRYHYVWKTSADWAGSCRRFTLKLADGTAHSAVFQLR
jgi:hypothetical protein